MSSPRGSSRRYKQDEKDNAVRPVRLNREDQLRARHERSQLGVVGHDVALYVFV